jgi:RNA polymerase sigma factor (sigma-70 family)
MAELDEAALDSLMARLALGERAAFDPLFQALEGRALRLARSRVDDASASDVAQSALLKVFARAHEFTPGRSALAWFYAIVANEVRSVQRKAHAQASLVEDLPMHTPSAEQVLIDRELGRALEAALSELDSAAAIAIHALLGRGPAPDVEPATLRKRVSRAYARLRILLGDLR